MDGFPGDPLPSGNGVEDGNDDFALNFIISSFINSFEPVAPAGSLIYEQTAIGYLDYSDIDYWFVNLHAGQTLGVTFEGESVYGATVYTYDFGGNYTPLGPHPISASADGSYLVGVTNAVGPYQLHLFLNSAVDVDGFLGTFGDNGDLPQAQDLDPSFISLGGSASRGAVQGNQHYGETIITSEDFEQPVGAWWTLLSDSPSAVVDQGGTAVFGAASLRMDGDPSHLGVDAPAALNEAIWSVDLSGLANSSVYMDFFMAANDEAQQFQGDFNGSFAADGVAISTDGITWHPIFQAPTYFDEALAFASYFIDLGSAASNVGIPLGPDFLIKFQQYSTPSDAGRVRQFDDIRIATFSNDSADSYRFSLQAGDSASIAYEGAGVNAQVNLYDEATQLLTTGLAGATNYDQSIRNFVAPATGTFYVQISGDAGPYSLVVTRNADFEREPNSEAPQAQDISLTKRVLGALQGDDIFDHYTFTANEGDNVELTVSSSALSPFSNLSPRLKLFDPSAALVANDENLDFDGQAGLIYTVPVGAAGLYRVVVEKNSGEGEYVLTVNGATGGSAPFTVTGTAPSSGAALSVFGFQVDFSEPLLQTSVQGDELFVNGTAEFGIYGVDPDTIGFYPYLTNHPDGLYTVTLLAGVLTSISGKPNEEFTATFVLDTAGPRVIESSLHDGDVLLPGPLVASIHFSEALATDGLGPEDVLLVDTLSGTTFSPSDFVYDAETSAVTLTLGSLPEGSYTLTLLSSSTGFRDVAGNYLDGSPSSPLPSGDGAPGGDLAVHFAVDVTSAPLAPLFPFHLAGSRISSTNGSISGVFHASGDIDAYTVDLDPGQTVTARLIPTNPSSVMGQIELADVTGTIATATAGAAGEFVLLQTAPATAGGLYTLRFKSLAGT
ncbi:MAG: PPC domain-containing protein, partial [Nitrospirae bacterium]|nr:PPC domain-containing protein [Nitrospirota bacterium]